MCIMRSATKFRTLSSFTDPGRRAVRRGWGKPETDLIVDVELGAGDGSNGIMNPPSPAAVEEVGFSAIFEFVDAHKERLFRKTLHVSQLVNTERRRPEIVEKRPQ
jgi:hypothetical protein